MEDSKVTSARRVTGAPGLALLMGAVCLSLLTVRAIAQSVFPGAGYTVDMLDKTVVIEPAKPMTNLAHRRQLRSALTAGGHAIVCRHGSTDWLANDIRDTASQAERDDRSVQRNLSDLGRAQAGAIREALDHLGVKIGPVLSTFYFRTREFAEMATGRKADPKEELLGIQHASIAPWWSVVAGSKGLTTTMFVSAHGQPAGAMKIRLGEGDCAIVRVETEMRLSVLGVITPSEWRQLLVP
jgi:hypothetical protein